MNIVMMINVKDCTMKKYFLHMFSVCIGCMNPLIGQKPDFGRWYDFTALPDVDRLPQTGSGLLAICPVPREISDLPKNLDALRKKWLLAWQNQRFNFKTEARQLPLILNECWRENFQPCTDQFWIKSVQNNANMENIDRVSQPGVILSHALVRTMPTEFPCFYKKPGYDFAPLDRLQNTLLNAGTPVYISHYSKDRGWVMIEDVAGKVVGFVQSCQVARMDAPTMASVIKLPIAVFSADNEAICDHSGQFLGYSRLGQIVFVKKQDTDNLWILWPISGKNDLVSWKVAKVSRKIAHTQPLPMNKNTITNLLDQLLGKPYGWGGALGNRDCSSMLQDYFRLFGFSLPRNSKAQIKAGIKIQSLVHLTNEQKERFISDHGVPYKTIIYTPGHVGLYVGTYKGRVLMAHARWSIVFMKQGYEGSRIIGKSIVSTLDFDRDVLGKTQDFMGKISAMTVVSL